MKGRYLTMLLSALFLAGALWSATALAGCLDQYQAGRKEYQEVRKENSDRRKLKRAEGSAPVSLSTDQTSNPAVDGILSGSIFLGEIQAESPTASHVESQTESLPASRAESQAENPPTSYTEGQAISLPSNHADIVTKGSSMIQANSLIANQDYCAWILIPGTKIDYPVVQGDDNIYYLTHTFRKKENPCGCIFADARASVFDSDNTVLYGHNMKDGSMFAGLKRYADPEYQKNNPEVWIWFRGNGYIYTIFSCQIRDEGDYRAYHCDFNTKEEKVRYLEDMKAHSLYATGVVPDPGEKILTLSTCYGDNKRMIVQGVMNKIKFL